jgi:hypothetical protein
MNPAVRLRVWLVLAPLLVPLMAALAAEPAPAPAPAPGPASPTVATINSAPMTLRDIEDALLQKEGAELIEEWVHKQLEQLNYGKLGEDDVILSIGFNKITRREIADALLRKGAGQVRDELIKIRLVEQAIAAAGIAIDEKALMATYERMRKRFEDQWAAKGETRIDFANFLQTKEKQTPEQFRAQPGFRMLAGLQALVHHRARDEFSEPDLRAWFEANRARWRQTEAVDLAVIAIPWRPEPGPDGKPVVTPAERERLTQVMDSLFRQVKADPKTFAQTWAVYARSYDPEITEGGHVGFVDRSGHRDGGSDKSRVIGAELMAACWQVTRFPTFVPPFASDWGVEFAVVMGHRPLREPVFEDLREQIRSDRIDETLEARTEALLRELKQQAKITYQSLPEIINGPR